MIRNAFARIWNWDDKKKGWIQRRLGSGFWVRKKWIESTVTNTVCRQHQTLHTGRKIQIAGRWQAIFPFDTNKSSHGFDFNSIRLIHPFRTGFIMERWGQYYCVLLLHVVIIGIVVVTVLPWSCRKHRCYYSRMARRMLCCCWWWWEGKDSHQRRHGTNRVWYYE